MLMPQPIATNTRIVVHKTNSTANSSIRASSGAIGPLPLAICTHHAVDDIAHCQPAESAGKPTAPLRCLSPATQAVAHRLPSVAATTPKLSTNSNLNLLPQPLASISVGTLRYLRIPTASPTMLLLLL
ncbi:hypothetical protein V8C42DRAFT_348629 [Trichoderma barbatum]